MKKILLTGLGSAVLSLALFAAPAFAATPNWNVVGTYQWLVLGTYAHDLVITSQNPDGTFSATGGYPAGDAPYTAAGQTPEVITGGQVSGGNITFTTTYTGPYNPGYSATVTGTIAPDGTMSGTSPWEWHTTSGNAVAIPQCNTDASQTIVSDASTQYNGGNSTVLDGTMVGAGILPPGAWAGITGASWIWGTNGALDDTTVPTTEDFTRSFSITGTPTSASIGLSADNGYVLIVNGSTVDSENVDPANEFNYQSVHTYNISSYVHTGANTLEIDVTNFGRAGTTFMNNPGGLVYSLTVNNNECVTPPPQTGSLTVTKNTVGGDGTFNFTGDAGSFSITTSGGTGSQTISDLTPDTYSVAESAASGWTLTSNTCTGVSVTAGQTATCTVTNTAQSSISGQKFNDLNRNGVKDSNEPGLQGWVIRLILDNPTTGADTLIATTTTDASGNYTFSNVAPGTYDVRETHQKGWKRQTKNPEDIVISAGSVVTDVDFGNATIRKGEKEDTDQDDDRNDQHGTYYANHGHSDYGQDQNKQGHQQPDNGHGGQGGNNNH